MKKIDGLIWRIVVLVLAILAAEAVSAWAKLPATKLRVPPTSGPEAPTLNGALACSNSSGSISPCTSSNSVYATTTGNLFIFTLNNTSSSLREGNISCGKTGPVSSCSVLTNTYSLNAHSSMTDTISYSVGVPGSGTVTATTSGTIGTLTATLSVTVTTPPYQDSVTPKGLSQSAVGLATNTVYFTVKNTGTNSATYNLSTLCVSTASACTITSGSSVTLASQASAFPTVTYTAGAVGTTGKVKLIATYSGNSAITDTGYFNDTSTASVIVTPDNASDTVPASTATSYTFHVSNALRPVSTTFNLSVSCTNPTTGCSVPASVTMDANAPDSSVRVSFTSAGSGANRTVKMFAAQSSDAANKDSGWVQVTSAVATLCNNGNSASITPCATSKNVVTGLPAGQSYTLTNSSGSTETFTYSCSVSGQIVPGSCTASGPASLATLGTGSVFVSFYATGALGSGSVLLTVNNAGTALTVPITVTIIAPPPTTPIHRVVLSPHYQALEEDPSQVDTVLYTIKNAGTDTATFRATRRCSGIGVASCVSAADSVWLKPDSVATLRLIFTMSAAIGSAGRDSLFIVQAADPTVRDSASIDLAASANSPGLAVSGLNPGSLFNRSLCLTISAGAGGAVECGDLRLLHIFPGVRTYNKARNPTLLYNSATAHPFITVRADETMPAGGGLPTTVNAKLVGGAGDSLAGGSWSGSQWVAKSTRRIAVGFDASAMITGIYPYTLVVVRKYGTDSSRSDSATGEFVVINRKASPFGPGWWVAGFEQLLSPGGATMLWIGGDGSAGKYTQVNDTTWGAGSASRPDSIKKRGGNYERLLPRHLIVRFNASGQQIATVNRLTQSTTFHSQAGTGLLDTITVAPTSAGMRFVFSYDTSGGQARLRRLTAPSINGQARYDSLRYDASNQVTTFRRIDASTVVLAYDATVTNRVISRTNERGYTTSYGFGPGGLVNQVTIPLDASNSGVTSITPWESRGISGTSATPADLAYAKVDGPRTDVGDSTLFWLDRFEEPRRIRSALGDETALSRGNAVWPALVTRLRTPRGQVFSAIFDSAANLIATTDSATYDAGSGRYATTRYSWLTNWDLPVKIVQPEGDSVKFGYDPTYGNLLWQQDGNGNQANFTYESAAGVTFNLPRTSQQPTLEVDSIFYDGVLGNLSRTRTPLGFTQNFATDGIGRVVRDSTPTDSSMWHVRTSAFDLLDQVTMTRDSAGGVFLQTLMHYDATGNLDTLKKLSVPDKAAIDTVTQVFAFDRANRKITDATVGYTSWTFTYDVAGNLISGGRTPTTNTYDAMNRVIKKVADDTATFFYDAGGNLVAANNSSARVARGFNLNGTLRADTLRTATDSIQVQDFGTFVYTQSFRYDLDGRRTTAGDNLSTLAADTVRYQYDPAAGMLTKITDIFGHQFRFGYDPDQRLDTLTRFADSASKAIGEKRHYDADGRLLARYIRGNGFTVLHDSLGYNAQNKVAHNFLNADSAHYNPLGQLVYGAYQPGGSERYVLDADGNQGTSLVIGESNQRWSWFYYDQHSNQLNHVVHPFAGVYQDTSNYHYFLGRQNLDQAIHPFDISCGNLCNKHTIERRQTISAFGADGRLRSTYFTLDSLPPPSIGYQRYTWTETYRYDALGRRIWRRIVRDSNCWLHDAASGCISAVTRTVWDGDRVLYEIRASAAPNLGVDRFRQFGTVGYLHAFGIDEPIELFKNVIEIPSLTLMLPYVNWRGNYELATCTLTICYPPFPSSEQSSYGNFFPHGQPDWYGDVVMGQVDGSGLLYRRNRYLDPKTGRFTQEDPLGIAGGLNAYGFAQSDPIGFSDPFGLCDKIKGTTAPCELFGVVWAEARGASSEMQVLVADVVLNRAAKHHGDVSGVIHKRKQFTAVTDPSAKNAANREAYARGVAGTPTKDEEAAFNEMVAFVELTYQFHEQGADITEGATLYYSPVSMQPSGKVPFWVNTKKMTLTYDLGSEGKAYKCKNGGEKC